MTGTLDVLSTPEWVCRLRPQWPHELSKVRQLYLSLYEAITHGELVDGQVLPSSRLLSQLLSVGRNTVIAVYTQLQDERLIMTDGRRGTQVTHCVPVADKASYAGDSDVCGVLSKRSASCVALSRSNSALAPGVPDASLFPVDAWRKAMMAATRLPAEHLGYSESALPQLQIAIARFLAIYRSLSVDPQQIIVTSSTRQSLALAAIMYANHDDYAWVETPGYPGAVDAFRMMGLTLSPISVDTNGADLNLSAKRKTPAIIYLTPCFQYPTGVALAPDRRRQILEYAEKHNAVIFEDDYDSEFRDVSQARPALASTRRREGSIVLHAGTFSKLIFPAVRIAWLVVPKSHVARSQQCLKALGGGSNTLAQAAVAEILNNGSLAKHLQRARHIYTQRRHALLEALEEIELLHPPRDTGGSLSLVVNLKKPLSAERLSIQLKKQQLGVQFVEELMWDEPTANKVQGLVLGLGNVSTLQIPATVRALERALQNARK
jgi:GntR family transcriptional regulator/MocR family aminotransferase